MMDVRKVTLTVGEAEMAASGLETLRQERMQADALVRVITLAEALEPHCRILAELRDAKIREHGTPGPNGEQARRIGPDDPGRAAFDAEMTEALAREVELAVPSLHLTDLWRTGPGGQRIPVDVTPEAAISLRKFLVLAPRPSGL
jgi:hypothetical protein